jgi:hypothetical protein
MKVLVPEFKTLKQIAAFINANPKLGLHAEMERGYASTDRKIPGTRLRRQGKGRTGARIKVFDTRAQPPKDYVRSFYGLVYGEHGLLVHDHNNAETYRQTSEVAEWLRNFLKGRK